MSRAEFWNGSLTVSPEVYQAIAIKHGLKFYAKTGKKVNRLYTPANMMRMASQITGRKFAPRAYIAAADALEEFIKHGVE